MSEQYRLGGRVETDTVAIAAVRQDQAGIQPSQTPPFISLVARHEISQGTEEPALRSLQSANPALPGNPPRRGRPPLPEGVIDPSLPASS